MGPLNGWHRNSTSKVAYAGCEAGKSHAVCGSRETARASQSGPTLSEGVCRSLRPVMGSLDALEGPPACMRRVTRMPPIARPAPSPWQGSHTGQTCCSSSSVSLSACLSLRSRSPRVFPLVSYRRTLNDPVTTHLRASSPVLRKHQHGSHLRGTLPHQACVVQVPARTQSVGVAKDGDRTHVTNTCTGVWCMPKVSCDWQEACMMGGYGS